MYFKQHYGKYDHCFKCQRKYLEVNLVADWSSSRTRCDYYCIRCYNRRDINETKETINETLQRRIKESGTRTTDLKGISLTQEMGKIESYFKQKI